MFATASPTTAPRHMADVHRAGRIGGDVLDVDLLAAADAGMPVTRPGPQDCRRLRRPEGVGEAKIDEARPRDLDARDIRVRLQPDGELHCQLARLRVRAASPEPSRHWWRHRHAKHRAAARPRSAPAPLRQPPARRRRRLLHRGSDPLLEQGEEIHRESCGRRPRRAAAFRSKSAAFGRALTQIGGVVKQPLMLGDRVAVGHAGDVVGDAARDLRTGRRRPRPSPQSSGMRDGSSKNASKRSATSASASLTGRMTLS